MSITSLISVARTGLVAQQAAIETISHNIANAETPGYSRQRLTMSPSLPQQFPFGSIGTGVSIASIERVRDTLLDGTYRSQAGDASFHAATHEMLSSVEGVLGEPSESGLSASMDAFWSSWSDLANDPTSSAARSVVQQRGAYVASLLNRMDQQLGLVEEQQTVRLRTSLDDLNALSTRVAELNASIVAAEASGHSAGDLRDQRDLKIDEMSKLADTRVFDRWDGSVQVVVGNVPVVDGLDAKRIELAGTAPLRLRVAGDADAVHESLGGSIAAFTGLLDRTVPEMRGRLDAIAQGLVAHVNGVHETGYVFTAGTPTGTAAGAFFHPGDPDLAAPPGLLPVTARTIRLANAVAADAGQIAASGNASGASNNAVASAMTGLRTAATSISYTPPGGGPTVTASFSEFYRQTVTMTGSQVRDAESASLAHETLAAQADQRRQSVSGVSTDEELVQLMRHQQAYAAASKLVNVADEMMRSILDMV